MPRSDFDAAAYLQELLAGVPPEEADMVKKVLTERQEIADRLADTVLHQKDYRRQTAELRKQEEALKTKDQQINDFYNRQLQIVQENQKFVDELQKRASAAEQAMAAYKAQFGDLEGTQVTTPQPQPRPDTITKEEFNKTLEQIQREGINVMSQMSRLTSTHYAEFKEPLDTDTLLKAAQDQHVDLKTAYESMVRDRRAEVAEHRMQEQLAAAREEGRRAALSEAKLPMIPASMEVSPLAARAAMSDADMQVPAWKRGVADFLAGKLGQSA